MKLETKAREPQYQEQILEKLLENHLREVNWSEDVTDIFFNGTSLFVHSLIGGRYQILNYSPDKAIDLVRQIANVMGKNFNTANPILDISFGKYRLNSVFSSIARSKNIPCITYAIRVIYPFQRITENDPLVGPKAIFKLLQQIVDSEISILISGKTGTGKTEMQKFLISKINPLSRIIMIEDTYESHIKELNPEKDISIWVVTDNQGHLSQQFSQLIKVGLRNNPDWMILSESRGSEAYEILHSVMTGHPMITTLHSASAKSNLLRMREMIGNQTDLTSHDLMLLIARYFPITIHMAKDSRLGAQAKRFIDEIIYHQVEDNQVVFHQIYSNSNSFLCPLLPESLAIKINTSREWHEKNNEQTT